MAESLELAFRTGLYVVIAIVLHRRSRFTQNKTTVFRHTDNHHNRINLRNFRLTQSIRSLSATAAFISCWRERDLCSERRFID